MGFSRASGGSKKDYHAGWNDAIKAAAVACLIDQDEWWETDPETTALHIQKQIRSLTIATKPKESPDAPQ